MNTIEISGSPKSTQAKSSWFRRAVLAVTFAAIGTMTLGAATTRPRRTGTATDMTTRITPTPALLRLAPLLPGILRLGLGLARWLGRAPRLAPLVVGWRAGSRWA